MDNPSILQRIEQSGVSVPRVSLRAAEEPEPQVSAALDLPVSGRYEVEGEIARGGVGVVLRGRDIDLGRDVAVKVLRKRHLGSAELVQRFVEEAQIGGQLQHPGIVPVYELGVQADERPFFAMKLVKGRTLSELLDARSEPGEDRRKLLTVFEQVCRTMAYAHSRGVIHRDLKPSNVMIGAFGEVQVVDWGFAKVLRKGGVADERRSRKSVREMTVVATPRSKGEGSESLAGSVMGTPAYMPPEQALGRVEDLDERSDVFALGAILTEILTGRPPYTGEGSTDILIQASRAHQDEALRELEGCGAPAELVDLAKRCITPVPKERPRSAGDLAEVVTRHLVTVDQRAHESRLSAIRERARAERSEAKAEAAEAAAREQRRRRRQHTAIAAAVLLLLVLSGGGYLWISESRAARQRAATAAVDEAMQEALRLRSRDLAGALAAAERAWELAEDEAVPGGRRSEAETLHSELAAASATAREEAARRARDAAMVTRLEECRFWAFGDEPSRIDEEYEAAFREYGIDVPVLNPEETVARIRATAIAEELADALDGWSRLRQGISGGRDAETLRRAADLALADWNEELRAVFGAGDEAKEKAFLQRAAELLPTLRLAKLGAHLARSRSPAEAAAFLKLCHHHRPGNLWINALLAEYLNQMEPPRHEESLRHRTAALALRPASAGLWNNLGATHGKLGETGPAVDAFRRAIALDPGNAMAHRNLCLVLRRRGDLEEALMVCRRACELDPESASAHLELGATLRELGRLDAAKAAVMRAIDLAPNLPAAHVGLGEVLRHRGKLREAAEAYRRAIHLDPLAPLAHSALGHVLGQLGELEDAMAVCLRAVELAPEDAECRTNLGVFLCERLEQHEEAVIHFEKAIALDAGSAVAHANLAMALLHLGRLDDALEASRKAVSLGPGVAHARYSLGGVLWKLGRADEALAAFRNAVELDPGLVDAFVDLGGLLEMEFGEHEEAVAMCRKAISLDARCARAWVNLSETFRRLNRLDEALDAARSAVDLDSRSAQGHLQLGVVLAQLGETGGAIGAYREAAALDPESGVPHYNLALLHYRSGEWKAARDEFERALRLRLTELPRPLLGNLHINLAWLLVSCPDESLRNPARAVELARRAVELAPEDPYALGTLGTALFRASDLTGAVETLRRAIGRHAAPELQHFVRLVLAMALWKLGEEEQARAELRKAVEWLDSHETEHEDLPRFRAEAEAMILGEPR